MFPNTGVISTSLLNFFDYSKLYKFFDENGIYLTVEKYGKNQWSYLISFKNGVVISPEQVSRETRIEIEIDGFIECFKYLENILIKNNIY